MNSIIAVFKVTSLLDRCRNTITDYYLLCQSNLIKQFKSLEGRVHSSLVVPERKSGVIDNITANMNLLPEASTS